MLLRDAYSVDVLIPIYISMLSEEDLKPSFPHSPHWSTMTDLDKAHILVKNYFLKLLAIIDFSDFSLKSVQSLFLI